MDITEVAKRSGIPASTLRFYEEKGLITSVGRRGLRRLFGANVLEQLALIAIGAVGADRARAFIWFFIRRNRPHVRV